MQQGFFSVQQTCPTCHGSGKEITDPCAACDGVGRTRKNKTLQVKIPAGIDDGMRIRSSGNGEPGVNGGPPGDLYVEIHLQEQDRKSVVSGKSVAVLVNLGGRRIIKKKK